MTAGDPEMGQPASVDAWIDVARRTHDDLADVVVRLDEVQLSRRSGTREWQVAQVLGHLGSQAEIGQATLEVALGRREPLGPNFNPEVWARWDALSHRSKADGFLRQSDALVRLYEELEPARRRSLRVDLSFLPEPADLATTVSLRVNELALHAWDVKVVDYSSATLFPPAAALLIDRFGALIRFIGHADPSRSFGIVVADIRRVFPGY